jgi:hypothetical protein
MSRHGEVLHETGQVAKADVDDLDAFVPRQLDDLFSSASLHVSSLVRPKGATIKQVDRRELGTSPFRRYCSTVNGV